MVSLVTVWGASLLFVHSTVVPLGIVSVAGVKAYLPFCSIICTLLLLAVAVVVGCKVAVGCEVAVGLGYGVVVPPPQATKRRVAAVANDKATHNHLTRLVERNKNFPISKISSAFAFNDIS